MKKKFYFRRLSWYFFLFTSLSISSLLKAQIPTFDCYIANDTFISPTVFHFDLYLLRTGTNVFEYAAGQYGFSINSACANGGVLTPGMVPNSSQLSNITERPTVISL